MSVIECFREACAIDMGDSVILTGGYYSQNKVTEVRIDGSYIELPELNLERYQHGCSSYLDEYGNKVTILIFIETTQHNYLLGLVSCWWVQWWISFLH